MRWRLRLRLHLAAFHGDTLPLGAAELVDVAGDYLRAAASDPGVVAYD